MNLNQGKRNKQAVQVLNKVEYGADGNPIGMMEDSSNPASANFGTPREPRKGGCYVSDGMGALSANSVLPTGITSLTCSLYIKIPTIVTSTGRITFYTNLAAPPPGFHVIKIGNGYITYEQIGLHNIPTSKNEWHLVTFRETQDSFDMWIDNDHIVKNHSHNKGFITSASYIRVNRPQENFGNSIIGLQYFLVRSFYNLTVAESQLVHSYPFGSHVQTLAKYNCSENSGNICYDSSGNGNHGTIINAITTTPEENPNSIHQYQDVYSFENEEGYSESGSVLIPKNSSITLPPFKDVLGNNLQYVGKVPGKAKFVNSSCFKGDSSAYLAITGLLTTDTIEVFGSSGTPTIPTNGELHVVAGDEVYGVKIFRSGILWAYLPLCEPIIDPSNHTSHDVSGNGNHATLVNGTLANEGKQDEFHYLQKGLKNDGINQIVPILDDESGFADGSLLTNENAIQQDSRSFLNTGTELEAYDYPALKQADKDDDFWNEDDGLGTVTPKPVQFDSLITQKGLSDKLSLDSSVSETIKNVRMYGNDLKGRQINTENKLTNNV